MAANVMTLMPGEIIECILEDPNITFSDIAKFSMTCKHLYRTVQNNNKLWRIKYFQRWPLLKEHYKESTVDLNVYNWLSEIQISIKIRNNLMHQLSLMSSKHYKRQGLSHSELRYLDPLFRPEEGAYRSSYHFLVDELISLINRPTVNNNLTHRYYAFIVLRYLKQNYLTIEWQKFINLPSDEQILEKGATIVAQWSQPERHIPYSYISSLLDDIANQTKKVLCQMHPNHPIFSLPAEQLLIWKRKNIDDNHWSTSETRQIIEALCEVLFQNLGFYGNSEMYYSSENSFIDRVLERKHGIPMILAIIFESVARRLGVRCEPVIFPSHFLLRWKEKYNVPEPENIESFYIDVLNDGQFLTREDCPRINGISRCPIAKYNAHNPATTVEVVKRMAYNLYTAARQHIHLNGRAARIRSALELHHMMKPHDIDIVLELSHFYLMNRMDVSEFVIILQNMQKDLEMRGQQSFIQPALLLLQKHRKIEEETEPKWRSPNVKYAVGLIMIHKTDNNLCVITGWDMPSNLFDRHNQPEGDNANFDQPYYNALADDGSSRCILQECLTFPSKPRLINHYEVGHYFSYFKGTHYVPNEETSKIYPGNKEVLENILKDYFN